MTYSNNYQIKLKRLITLAIATVWIVNGLYCKLLNFVPRHQEIVSRILGLEYAGLATKIIGILEILMAVWIISRIRPKLCAVIQILVVATMNIIEFFVVQDLLLFGRINLIFAALFLVVVYYNEFRLNAKRPIHNQ